MVRRTRRSGKAATGGKGKPGKANGGGGGKGGAIPNEWHKRNPEHNPKYKSELCKSWTTTGACRFGAGCVFAHGASELRSAVPDAHVAAATPAKPSGRSRRAGGGRQRAEPAPAVCPPCADPEPEPVQPASQPVSPVASESGDVEPAGPPLLLRSDSVRAADGLFLSDEVETVVLGENVNKARSRFSFAATPRDTTAQWTTAECVRWAKARGVSTAVAERFREHEIDGSDLLCLTKENLREMGIVQMGPLLKLTKGLTELQNGPGQAVAPATKPDAPHETGMKELVPFFGSDCQLEEMHGLEDCHAIAQPVSAQQLWEEAAAVLERGDHAAELNIVLQSADAANKSAEVIRGDAAGGRSLPMVAAQHGRPACLRRLLAVPAGKASVNAATADNLDTALHQAAAAGSEPCVSALLEAGADPSLRNKHGVDAARIAADHNNTGIATAIARAVLRKAKGAAKKPHVSRAKLADDLSAWRQGAPTRTRGAGGGRQRQGRRASGPSGSAASAA